MTTILEQPSGDRGERTFFVAMALLLALTVLAGFGSWALRGMIVQPVPVHVHVHGGLFVAWIALFITQTILIRRDARSLHRLLGWSALLLAAAMLAAGAHTAMESVRLGRVPPFFPANIFLSLSFLELATFAALLLAGIAMRGKTAWHRRLMLGATIALVGPALGRILPMPILGPMGGLAVMGIQMCFVLVAMTYDVNQRKSVHPAHFWTMGALLVQGVGTPLLGGSAPFIALAQALSPQ